MISPSADLPSQIYKTRRQKIVARASKAGCDTVLAFGYGSALGAGSKSHGALRYLTGWDSHEATSLLIMDHRDTYLVISSPFMVPVARETLQDIEIVDLRPSDWTTFLATQSASLKTAGTIGFDEMPLAVFRALTPLLDSFHTKAIDQQLGEMQLVKDDAALAFHDIGAKICDRLFSSLKDEISQDKACWEIQLALETRARELGANYCRTWLTARSIADHPRYWPEEGLHVPQTGDQVLLGIALCVAGHWAHGIRMGSLGSAPAHHKVMWHQVSEMLEAGIEALKPGESLRTCADAMDQILGRHFSEQELSNIVRFRNGHGLGTSYEDPLITDCFPQCFGDSPQPAQNTRGDLTVQPGMLLELHPNYFLPGRGGAAIGEMILIGDSGAKCLLKHPIAFMEL